MELRTLRLPDCTYLTTGGGQEHRRLQQASEHSLKLRDEATITHQPKVELGPLIGASALQLSNDIGV